MAIEQSLTNPGTYDLPERASAAPPRLFAWRLADASAHIPRSVLAAAAAATDAIALALAGFLARDLAGLTEELHGAAILLAALATALALGAAGFYARGSLTRQTPRSALTSACVASAAFAALALAAGIFDRAGIMTGTEATVLMVVTALAAGFGRASFSALALRWAARGRFEQRTVIYGAGAATAGLIRTLETDTDTDLSIVGVCDDRGRSRVGDDVLGYPVIGTLDDLLAHARKSRVDTVIVSLPLGAEQRLGHLLERLSILPADIRQPDERATVRVGPVAVRAVLDKPMGTWGLIAKSLFDKLVAATALLFLGPVLLGVAAAVRLDSRGPVLFRQKRYGFNNELIEVFKFRSMYVDMSDATASRLVTRDDPRVTPVGRIIRKTSLDELPQLLNVLRGDLSLVGPRPHAVNAKAANRLYGEVVNRYFARHKVKPGITGWAQINGWRGETDTEEKIIRRVEHDLDYIANWSLWLDLKILLKTPLSLLKTDNAY